MSPARQGLAKQARPIGSKGLRLRRMGAVDNPSLRSDRFPACLVAGTAAQQLPVSMRGHPFGTSQMALKGFARPVGLVPGVNA